MTKKNFNYKYDETMELIIKSLTNKSYLTSRDIQILMDTLLRNAYAKSRKRI
jgi:hypothetical protein